MTAIEMDRRCLPALAELGDAFPGQLRVIEGDALKLDHAELMGGEPFAVLSNLPYNVGTALFTRWLEPAAWPPQWLSLTLMFQLEVAERIVAPVGSSAYGRLAVLAQWRAQAKLAMKVHRSAFTPPPKVSSSVVHLTALPEPRYPADAGVLSRVTAMAFQQRRKMLRASLKGLGGDVEGLLEEAGIKPTARAEEIGLEHFCALARLVACLLYTSPSPRD